jgi:enoyl-[acyl-carrier protein] reductase II
MTSALLAKQWKQGTDFLGTEYAILGGAMSWVSEATLVSAISNAGGFGVIACGAMTPDLLDAEITKTFAKTTMPFGVNLITMHPDIDALIAVCAKHNITHVVLAGGLPKTSSIDAIKAGGAKVMCFAPARSIAKKLVRDGVDALVIEGSEAGGHIGPVSTSVLAQEVLPFVAEHFPHIPVFVAGGIGRGEAIVEYLRMGAAGVQIGTRLVCAEESIAHASFKQLFIKSKAKDAVASVQIDRDLPVIPVRAIANKATQEFEELQIITSAKLKSGEINKHEAMMEVEHYWAGALRRAVIDGDVETGSVMAGQSVGMVETIEPAHTIIDTLVSQAEAQLNKD